MPIISTSTFHNKRMNATSTAPNGVVNAETIFHFSVQEEVIIAAYAGGKVLQGHLIGKLVGDRFEFQYSQIHKDMKLDGGHSICEVELTDDGRIRLIERFEWSEGKGTNIIEEMI